MIDLEKLCMRVTNTQNKAKSLKWGAHLEADNSAMFAVGHQFYGNKVLFIHLKVYSSEVEVSYYKRYGRDSESVVKCADEESVLKEVRRILSLEFPAVSSEGRV